MCRMSIDFYYISLSTPCRSVMMTTAYMAGVDVNLKLLNLMNGYQLKPESLKISLQHNVPTIVDDGFCLNESQAICAYLINRHGGQKGQHLYPEDAQQRAVIDQLLNLDSSVLFANTRDLYVRNNRVCDMRARLVTSYKNQSITFPPPPLLYPKWERPHHIDVMSNGYICRFLW